MSRGTKFGLVGILILTVVAGAVILDSDIDSAPDGKQQAKAGAKTPEARTEVRRRTTGPQRNTRNSNREASKRNTSNRNTANRSTANRSTANRSTANRSNPTRNNTANRSTPNRSTANRNTANRNETANRGTANGNSVNRESGRASGNQLPGEAGLTKMTPKPEGPVRAVPATTNGTEKVKPARSSFGNETRRGNESGRTKDRNNTKPSTPKKPKPTIYEVKEGDSLWNIASRHYKDPTQVARILRANPELGDGELLKIGMKITLPAPLEKKKTTKTAKKKPAARAGFKTYVVQEGDTLSDIARAHLGEAKLWPDIVKANPGLDADRISVGQVLYLPK